jgi:hypothetical protein
MDALRRAFHDISVGYSTEKLMGKVVYVKHLNYSDQTDNDVKREEYFNEAAAQGLFTNDKKLAALIKEGEWSDKKEQEIVAAKNQITSLIEGKQKNMKMPSLVKSYTEMIKKEEAAYIEKAMAKSRLLGLTCESYADRQLNDYYIYTNLFADRALTESFFTQDAFDYLTESEMIMVTETYNRAMDTCSDPNIKKLAIQPFFQNYFNLTGEMLGQFFGKPICFLTFFQVRLLGCGAHYRNIFSNHDVSKFPANVREDPDLLSDYASAAKKGKADMENQGAYDKDAIVVGAKKEDASVLGVNTRPGLASEIAGSGGNVVEWLRKRG